MGSSETNDQVFHLTKNSLQKSKQLSVFLGFWYYILFSDLSRAPKYCSAVTVCDWCWI